MKTWCFLRSIISDVDRSLYIYKYVLLLELYHQTDINYHWYHPNLCHIYKYYNVYIILLNYAN